MSASHEAGGEPAATRPVIGVSAYEEPARWNQWSDIEAALVPARYIRAVERGGGIAVMIPVQSLSPGDLRVVLGRLDGLVLTGGPDVDPSRYGAERHERTGEARSSRDEIEMGLCEASTEMELPTLAVCRGLQVLNVVRGGTLHQHLPDVYGHEEHAPVPSGYGDHGVKVVPGTLLQRVLGWDAGSVPTHHHQGIDVLGRGLAPSAFADDGLVEAVEDPSLPFLLGVQWHPEVSDDVSLFAGLAKAASSR